MAKNKVKPRLAIWVGAAGSAVVAAGEVSGGPIPRNIREDIKGKVGPMKGIAANLEAITTNSKAAVAVAAPALIGTGVSILADKIGLNQALAKAKAPFRI